MHQDASAAAASPVCRPIEGELTIYRAQELKDQLFAALASARELELDLGAVTEIDTAGVQVLVALKRAAQAQGRTLRLRAHSTPVLDTLDLLGLAAFFGDPLIEAHRGNTR
jgi:anti-anti-sigma factor